MITFGFEPYPIEVVLARGTGFATAVVSEEPWPDNTAIELRFTAADQHTDGPVVWPATLDDTQASWDVTAEQVSELVDSGARRAHLMFISGGTPVLWGRGPARVIS